MDTSNPSTLQLRWTCLPTGYLGEPPKLATLLTAVSLKDNQSASLVPQAPLGFYLVRLVGVMVQLAGRWRSFAFGMPILSASWLSPINGRLRGADQTIYAIKPPNSYIVSCLLGYAGKVAVTSSAELNRNNDLFAGIQLNNLKPRPDGSSSPRVTEVDCKQWSVEKSLLDCGTEAGKPCNMSMDAVFAHKIVAHTRIRGWHLAPSRRRPGLDLSTASIGRAMVHWGRCPPCKSG